MYVLHDLDKVKRTRLFMVFDVTYPSLRHMLGYNNEQQLHH